jgi:hypothetical protein
MSMPDLPFKPDTREQILLALVLDRLDALLAAVTPEPPAQPVPTPAPRKRAPRKLAEEA